MGSTGRRLSENQTNLNLTFFTRGNRHFGLDTFYLDYLVYRNNNDQKRACIELHVGISIFITESHSLFYINE